MCNGSTFADNVARYHNFNENQFQILSTGNSDFDCKIREVL